MKKYSKLMAVLLVVAMLLPGIAQAAPIVHKNGVEVIRIEGKGRIETAIEVSKRAYEDGSSKVAVLAGYDGEADALTGTLLADNKKAPLLLTYKNKLDAGLVDELNRLGVEDVYVLGGDKVVFAEVRKALKTEGFNLIELEGSNRAGTAIEIAKEIFGEDTPAEAFIVQNNSLADALAIGPVAAEKNAPIFLTNKDTVPASTKAALEAMGIETATIVGGTSVVTEAGKKALEAIVETVDRVEGTNRERTAVAIADRYFENPEAVVVANGYQFADALVGGYFARLNNAPILLTQANKITGYTLDVIAEANVDTYVLGGDKAISKSVLESIEEALGEEVVEDELKVESVSAINKTTVEVVLSQEVDTVTAANFTIEGGNVTAASLDSDKKTVTLSVSGLNYDTNYTLVTKDIMVDGELEDFGSKAFKSPAVTDLWELQIVTSAPQLIADGADNLQVTFNLLSKETGKVDKDADNIVLDLNATYGTLASKRVTVQDGTATVLLTSEFSNTNINSKIDAQIIEASGDYKDLIGKVSQSINVPFITTTTENVDTLTLVSAEANQADRITLFFDKEISLKHFVKTNDDGDLYYNVAGVEKLARDIVLEETDPETISHVFKVAGKTVEIAQGTNKNFKVQGFKPVAGNSKAVEVILDKTTVLKDNANVEIEVVAVNSIGKETTSSAEFKVTDARKPEATSVSVEGLNTLKVKFSEAIADADFKIDGRFNEPAHFDSSFGHFNPVTLVDNRDLATIVLNAGYDEDGIDDSHADNKTLAGYFSAGNHTLQISSTKDFAYATDSSNIGTTQNLSFTIAEDKSQPTATITVESPEQFRLKFDKVVSATEAQVQAFITGANEEVKLQVKDSNGTYVDANGLTAGKVNKASDLKVTKVSDTEFKIELTRDWTVIHNTNGTNKNYYNYEYRIVIAKNAFVNVANGLKNEKMELGLNYTGSPLNSPDTTSPVISNVVRLGTTNKLEVTMNEPVKLVLSNGVSADGENTLAQTQGVLTKTTVQFIGKDKDGKIVTIDGEVTGYTNKDKGADSKFGINWKVLPVGTVTPQSVVDAGGNAEWDVVVRAISDDVGNTAASATFKINLEKSASTNSPFFIKKYVAPNAKAGKHMVEGKSHTKNQTNNDTITITFSEGVQFKGLSDATNPANYTLNGETLPAGTGIAISDADSDTTNGFEIVTMSLPKGTLNLGAKVSNVMTVNKNLVSYDGSKIIRDTEVVINMDENNDLVDAAQAVKDKIVALPAVGAVVSTDKTAIETARANYDALSADQKALVSNYSVLQALEAELTDVLAAKVIEDEIATLPAVVTSSHKVAIETARANYEALSADQKAKVDVTALEVAEDELFLALVTDSSVGTVELTKDINIGSVYEDRVMVTENKIINLNGNTIQGGIEINANGKNVVINGGKIENYEGLTDQKVSVYLRNGKLTLNNVTINNLDGVASSTGIEAAAGTLIVKNSTINVTSKGEKAVYGIYAGAGVKVTSIGNTVNLTSAGKTFVYGTGDENKTLTSDLAEFTTSGTILTKADYGVRVWGKNITDKDTQKTYIQTILNQDADIPQNGQYFNESFLDYPGL